MIKASEYAECSYCIGRFAAGLVTPDQFKTGADLVVEGALLNGVFVAKRGSIITKCPDHYAPAKSSNT